MKDLSFHGSFLYIVNLKNVAIAGATGYSGQELVQLLKRHPHFEIKALVGRNDRPADFKGKVDLVFLCTPNDVSLEMAPLFLAEGIHVIDVSGAFRLKKHSYPEWYGFEHLAPEYLKQAEYSLIGWDHPVPAQSQKARLIANPGCYPTATLLALLPLVKDEIIDTSGIFVDAKSGTSGAGKKAETSLLFSEIYGDFYPYKVGKHQHYPEIIECVERLCGKKLSLCFTTSLLPVERGISAAVFGNFSTALHSLSSAEKLSCLMTSYQKYYSAFPDIVVGTDPALSHLKKVVHSNRCHIQVNCAFDKIAVFSSIDNLLRGAAGQALLNANLLAGRSMMEGFNL